MRIVSWNMNHWQNPPAKRGAAWEYLRDELRADIALVQEAIPPTDLQAAFRSIDDVHPRYRWGSAVVSFRPELVVRGSTAAVAPSVVDQGLTVSV